MNCDMGNNANFSYQQITASAYAVKLEEITEALAVNMEIPPK